MTVPQKVKLARHPIDLDDDGHEFVELGVTTETDDTLVLAPDGAGGVEWRAETGGSAAPNNADYLVGTANGSLSAEIVVGTTPGGELGGTWASPTVDGTHSGSAHSDFIAKAIVDVKGDLIAATAADTVARVPVGTDGQYLKADSGATAGVSWATLTVPPTGVGQLIIADSPSTPLVFADLIQNEAQDDLVYADI